MFFHFLNTFFLNFKINLFIPFLNIQDERNLRKNKKFNDINFLEFLIRRNPLFREIPTKLKKIFYINLKITATSQLSYKRTVIK